jgi:hypothetical protein
MIMINHHRVLWADGLRLPDVGQLYKKTSVL